MDLPAIPDRALEVESNGFKLTQGSANYSGRDNLVGFMGGLDEFCCFYRPQERT